MAKKIHLTVRISESLNERIDRLVASTGSSKNAVLNECLRRGALSTRYIPMLLPPSKENLAEFLKELDEICQDALIGLEFLTGD